MRKNGTLIPQVKGQGFYSGFFGDLGSTIGSGLGSLLGSKDIGRSIGSGLGGLVGKVTGLGSYKVNSNTLMADTGTPVFGNGAEGSITVSRREFVADVKGSIAFRNNTFRLNPGNPALFPWLSQIARGYEQYEILGMIMEYRPTSGSAIASTNNALGVVIMTTNYDVLDPSFTNKQQMESYQYTISSVPSNHAIHAIECKRNLNVLDAMYVRQFVQPLEADPRFYDLGLFQVATVGMQADDITVGELWVSYHVKLIKPRLPDSPVMSFTGAGSNAIMSSGLANPIPTSTYTPPVTPLSIPNYTASAGSLAIALDEPGNYSWNSYGFNTGTTSSAGVYEFNSTSSSNVSSVANWLGANLLDFNTEFKGTNASSSIIFSYSGSSTSTNMINVSSAINVGRGGGTAVFTLTPDATISSSKLKLTYEGYQSPTSLAGDGVSVMVGSGRTQQMRAIEERLKALERDTGFRIVEEEEEQKEYIKAKRK